MNSAFAGPFLVKTEGNAFSIPQALRGVATNVAIYDLTGKLVRKDFVKAGRTQLDVPRDVKPGVYIVRVNALPKR
jgi:hypothetical protein